MLPIPSHTRDRKGHEWREKSGDVSRVKIQGLMYSPYILINAYLHTERMVKRVRPHHLNGELSIALVLYVIFKVTAMPKLILTHRFVCMMDKQLPRA